MGPLKNMEPQRRKRFRRLFFMAVGLALVSWIGWSVVTGVLNQTVNVAPATTPTATTPTTTTGTTPITTVPTPTTTTGTTPITPPPPPPVTSPTQPIKSAPQPNTKRAAIKAAEVAINNVTTEMLFVVKGIDGKYHPSSRLVKMVSHLVAPARRQYTLSNAPADAQALAQVWHWPSVEAASVGANYYVEPKQYKVTSFGKGHATIWLETKTGFTTLPAPNENPPDPGGKHYAYDLLVVNMVRINAHWLFVESHEPPGVAATFDRMARGLDNSVYEDALQPFMTGGFRNANDLPKG